MKVELTLNEVKHALGMWLHETFSENHMISSVSVNQNSISACIDINIVKDAETSDALREGE